MDKEALKEKAKEFIKKCNVFPLVTANEGGVIHLAFAEGDDPARMDDRDPIAEPLALAVGVHGHDEPALAGAEKGCNYQFERLGYFCLDSRDSTPEDLVFNRTVPLRDSWAKMAGKERFRK